MKRTAVDHNKTNYLKTLLKRPRFQVLGILESLWQLTAKDCQRGDIGRLPNERIASAMEWDGPPAELINALEMAGFIDPHPVHRYIVHDWPHHCEDLVHIQLARKIEFFADGSMPKLGRLYPKEKAAIQAKYKDALNGRKIEPKTLLFNDEQDSVRTTYAEDMRTLHAEPLPLPPPLLYEIKSTLSPHDPPPQESTGESESVSPMADKKPEKFEFPTVLDVDEFHEIWRMFKSHCREKGKPHTRVQAETQLSKLAGFGLPGALASLRITIEAGLCIPLDPPPQKSIRKPDNVPRLTPDQLRQQQAEIEKNRENGLKAGRPAY